MLDRERVEELLRERSRYLSDEFGVRRIGLFGSFSRGDAGEASDVDLVVEFDRPIGLRFMNLADYLEGLLGRRVDLLTPEGLRSIRNPRIAREIATSLRYV
jgi:predicted nucleotidyltransferase